MRPTYVVPLSCRRNRLLMRMIVETTVLDENHIKFVGQAETALRTFAVVFFAEAGQLVQLGIEQLFDRAAGLFIEPGLQELPVMIDIKLGNLVCCREFMRHDDREARIVNPSCRIHRSVATIDKRLNLIAIKCRRDSRNMMCDQM